MKLCIVTPSFAGGGAERVAVNLANEYARQGVDVCLLAFNAFGPYKEQVSPVVKVVDLNVSRVRYVFWRLRSALKKEQPDVVLSVIRSSNIFVGLTGYFFYKLKIVFREASTMHGIKELPFLKRMVHILLMRLAYSRANSLIANSYDTMMDMLAIKIGDKPKIRVIGNPVLPVNYNELASELPNHPWLVDDNLKVILTVGRLHKLKNQAMLIQAFSKLKELNSDLRLIILGEGEERPALIDFAQSIGVLDCVDIVPFQSNPYPFYKNADVFVLTSKWEGFGNVLVEAMACNIPVISTDCPGGPREILNDGEYGTLVPCDNVDRLAIEIEDKIRSKPCNVSAASEKARSYTISEVANAYLECLR